MSDLIERDRVLNLLKKHKSGLQGMKGPLSIVEYYTGKLIEKIDEMPSADVPDINVGDMISRKQAVEAMGEEPMVWNDDDEYALGQRNQWKADVKALRELPSAEPEPCEDAVSLMVDAINHFRRIIEASNTDSDYNTGFVDGLEFAISHLSVMVDEVRRRTE